MENDKNKPTWGDANSFLDLSKRAIFTPQQNLMKFWALGIVGPHNTMHGNRGAVYFQVYNRPSLP